MFLAKLAAVEQIPRMIYDIYNRGNNYSTQQTCSEVTVISVRRKPDPVSAKGISVLF